MFSRTQSAFKNEYSESMQHNVESDSSLVSINAAAAATAPKIANTVAVMQQTASKANKDATNAANAAKPAMRAGIVWHFAIENLGGKLV